MAKVGDSLDNGNVRLCFLCTTEETAGDRVEVEAFYKPRSLPPPRHYHPAQVETFHVQDGRLHFELDGVSRVVHSGESVVVPVGAVHRAWNAEDATARATWITRPALQTEKFFETLWGLAQDGRVDKNGRPGLLQIALTARHFADTWVLASPPPLVQSCVFGLLAPVARALGYQPEYTPRS